MITIERMDPSDLPRIEEIDRSEEITEDYEVRDGKLVGKTVDWKVPGWKREGEGPHSVRGMIRDWREFLRDDWSMWGAFDGDRLVGFSIHKPQWREGVDLFGVLHVSRPYRGQGIGRRLAGRVIDAARSGTASSLYVSATPTKRTVEFYLALGFELATSPDAVHFELEPEDIHMELELERNGVRAGFKRQYARQVAVSIALVFLVPALFLAIQSEAGTPWIAAIAVLLAAVTIYAYWNWRCPACRRYLGNMNLSFCSRCGVRLR